MSYVNSFQLNFASRYSQNLVSAWRIHATYVQDDARRVSREHRDVVTSNRYATVINDIQEASTVLMILIKVRNCQALTHYSV